MNKINAGHAYQRVPISHLGRTIETWNGYVTAGADPEFERENDAPTYAIANPSPSSRGSP